MLSLSPVPVVDSKRRFTLIGILAAISGLIPLSIYAWLPAEDLSRMRLAPEAEQSEQQERAFDKALLVNGRHNTSTNGTKRKFEQCRQ
jgi:hypothetical protein